MTDLIAEQRRVDLWSLAQERLGLANAKAKGLPMAIAMYRRSVVRMYLRTRRQKENGK